MQGILNINKPEGITSFDVIAKLRKILDIKKIGHAGTLDPLASGVLPIFVDKATRLIQYAPKVKSYRAVARLGTETTTYDREGEVVSKKIKKYDIEEIKKILKTFEGKISQTPPVYSAISVKGKRLYEYARNNQEVEIPTKKVEVFNIEVVNFKQDEDFPLLTFDIDCGSGVYIRSIIHDLGANLQSGAMMENLTRTMSANLKIENSINLSDITQENAETFFINTNDIVDLPAVELEKEQIEKIKMGQYIFCGEDIKANSLVKLVSNNTLIAVGNFNGDVIKPKTVIV